jgi:D-beta-D-heptose 7-phosphate kinase/D-beta-D-heptose 1-phosphate adenosyltransferase
MVDYVTLFTEDTPYELIRALKPDVLVKGGDWRKEDIVGADLVAEVHSLPFVEGMSTTGIIDKIRSLT